jgi:hypothetical protein
LNKVEQTPRLHLLVNLDHTSCDELTNWAAWFW